MSITLQFYYMMYRNLTDLISIEGIPVDAGSLWKYNKQLNLLVLVDNDQYVTMQLSDAFDEA